MPYENQIALKIQYLKLKRINELNNTLKTELARERITASNASLNLINYTTTKEDFVISEIWGYPKPGSNHFRNSLSAGLSRKRVNVNSNDACCTIV
ncbi:hypothetical protein TPHA_0E00570 [Tetrapisispora phaffii CBS 4417]|uniref:Guanine nucleotide-binding protein subunit gamma n=1 Tax=Tetrapisispora phaffii (strain ATCC 24235 / CBS 4417 / NBRC 1672 / NRRL Y-8282 / UCD 70-5) TaxID=1071381 RepID=G8BTC4_TETPH|nr:hypothetical protein TPHA_0E00570 [Tetrapisispora phaffii CBS 4417]CCE63152.1 hypothetical protein TPHA_0E00570 [Tetrapisispora phaffii CBS 4417]